MKTLWDAVNELKGDLNNSYEYMGEGLICFNEDSKKWVCYNENLTESGAINLDSYRVCVVSAFHKLVKDMEYNLGKCSAVDVYDYARGKKEPLKPISKSLVYTQEMSDNGELPSVGMECYMVYPQGSHDCLVLGYNDDYIWFRGMGIHRTYRADKCEFKPIDTRTNKEKAINEIRAKCGFNKLNSIEIDLLHKAYDEWVGKK